MKKIILALFVAGVFAFASCGETKKEETTPPAETTETPAEAPAETTEAPADAPVEEAPADVVAE